MMILRSMRARSQLPALVVILVAASTPAMGTAPENPFEELAVVEEARLQAAAGGAAAIGPLMAMMELAQVLAPGRFDAALSRLVRPEGKAAGDPLVAARARDWLALRAEEKGDDGGAAQLREPLGLLSRFWAVGPFGDGRASIDVPYPPESDRERPTVDRAYPGKERSVAWRRAVTAIRRGSLDLGALLRPASQAAAYAVAFVRVDQAADVALRLGTPGPVKIWCNGIPVHAADVERSARFDQDAVGIHFRAGWNRLLFKTVVTNGAWRLFARLTTPGGDRLHFTNEWDPPSSGPGAIEPALSEKAGVSRAAARTSSRIAVRALEPFLRERVRAAKSPEAAGRAGLDLGRYLLLVDPADRDRKEAAHAFESSAASHPMVEALMGLSSAEPEENASRRALERALAIAKTSRDRARVLAALGDVARNQHRDAVAIERWRGALELEPRWWPATLSLAGEEQAAGFPAAALARVEALPAVVRAIPPVARERARLLMALDRRADAEKTWRGLLQDARDNVDLLRDLAGAARARGDTTESIRLLGKAAALRPDLPGLAVDWARELEGARNPDEARRVLEAAARQLPDEPILATEIAKLLDRMGQSSQALEWLKIAVELRPQDPELRRYADSVASRRPAPGAVPSTSKRSDPGESGDKPATGGELSRRFAAPVPALIAAEMARSVSNPRGPGTTGRAAELAGKEAVSSESDPAVVLLDRRAVRVHHNGLSEVFAQRVVQVLTDSGARDNQEFFVRYAPGSEEVEILEARIFRRGPDGDLEVLQATERDDQDLSEPWYGLYYDYRAEVVRFEGLRPGDVWEVQYLVSDVSDGNQLAGYFGDLQFIAELVPKRRWDYTLVAPRGRNFHFARPAVAGLSESASDNGDERLTQFTARDIRRVDAEPAMPGIGEISPYLHVSTYGSWDEVGAWYWRLIEEQLVPDDTVRRAADGAIRSAAAEMRSKGGRTTMTVADKVRALHALVVGGTRYVGLEFGIHGFKPYKVSQVLARKFGDCKDKAALLVALLSQVGVDAEMVLLRTRRNGRIAPAPASLAIFDHAIVYVPKLGLYLDGTAEFSGMKELPNQDQGAMVLRIGPHGTKLMDTPVLPSAENRALRVWNVRLKADGDGEIDERLAIDGQAAAEWRAHYQTPGERMDRYAKVWTGRNPGSHLTAVDMPGIGDRNQPVTVNAKATVPGVAESTPDGGLLLRLGAREVDLVRTYARLSSRTSDLVLAYPWRHDEVVTYQLPRDFRVTSLPASRVVETRFGRFVLRVQTVNPREVTADARLDVAQDRIAPADYGDFRRFLADVDAVMAERIVIERAPEPEHPGVAGTIGR
jgi:cellulose synthase operon protein C